MDSSGVLRPDRCAAPRCHRRSARRLHMRSLDLRFHGACRSHEVDGCIAEIQEPSDIAEALGLERQPVRARFLQIRVSCRQDPAPLPVVRLPRNERIKTLAAVAILCDDPESVPTEEFADKDTDRCCRVWIPSGPTGNRRTPQCTPTLPRTGRLPHHRTQSVCTWNRGRSVSCAASRSWISR